MESVLLRKSKLKTPPRRESVKYTWNNQSSEDNMQLFDTKSLRLQLCLRRYMRWKCMLVYFSRFYIFMCKQQSGPDSREEDDDDVSSCASDIQICSFDCWWRRNRSLSTEGDIHLRRRWRRNADWNRKLLQVGSAVYCVHAAEAVHIHFS